MEKELKLSHIQHYPIGGENALRILHEDCTVLLVGVTDECLEVQIRDSKYPNSICPIQIDLKKCKPILRPMSDLCKPLEDGSIPLIELAKIATEPYGEFTYSVVVDKDIDANGEVHCYSSKLKVRILFKYADGLSGFAVITENDGDSIPPFNQLQLFEYLFKHHFNVFNLSPDLYIDIKTIEK